MTAQVTASTPYVDLPEYLTPAELCLVLRIGRTASYELIRSGSLPALRCGRMLRIPKSALLALQQELQS